MCIGAGRLHVVLVEHAALEMSLVSPALLSPDPPLYFPVLCGR